VAWAKNRTKSKVRAKVEHVFQVMKLKFGFVKVRYRGLKKKRLSPPRIQTRDRSQNHRRFFESTIHRNSRLICLCSFGQGAFPETAGPPDRHTHPCALRGGGLRPDLGYDVADVLLLDPTNIRAAGRSKFNMLEIGFGPSFGFAYSLPNNG
jgi:hypothetical protein